LATAFDGTWASHDDEGITPHHRVSQWEDGGFWLKFSTGNFEWFVYWYNPFDINPLRDIVAERVDFEALRSSGLKLFINATNVRTGRVRALLHAWHMHLRPSARLGAGPPTAYFACFGKRAPDGD